jgi:hypothetical protein
MYKGLGNGWILWHIWTSPDGQTHSQIHRVLIDRRRHSIVLDVRSVRGADCDTEIGWGNVNWIQLAQDRGRWRALVNKVMNPRLMAPRS